jgi:cell division septal protein FtsQ
MWFRSSREGRAPGNRRRVYSRNPILRVSARASDKRRDRLHKAGAIVVLCAALGGAAWVAVLGAGAARERLFTRNAGFTIRTLKLTSTGRLGDAHLREYAHVAEGMNLFAVDIHRIRRDLESIPLIRSAVVRRELPSTLCIEVVERRPIARVWQGERTYSLAVDEEGHVVGPALRLETLPLITGCADRGLAPGSRLQDETALDALEAIALCDGTALGSAIGIAQADVSPREHIVLRLRQGEKVLVGREGLRGRLEKLAESLQRAAEMGRRIATIDLTVDRNVPVEFAEK